MRIETKEYSRGGGEHGLGGASSAEEEEINQIDAKVKQDHKS